MNAIVESKPYATPIQLLQIAVERGDDMDKLRQLMDLKDRWEAGEARKAYVSAVAAFKSEPSKIFKTKKVDIAGGAKFAHATLADVCDGVVANLGKNGLSHSFELKQMDNGWVEVACIITHEQGHSERTVLRAPPDDSGKMNTIQRIASTVTYLERYTLVAALGLSAKDVDDDGRGAAGAKNVEPEPDGYANWKADMTALADEGGERLTAAWAATSPVFRRHVIKFDESWWNDSKAKAAKATKASRIVQ